MRLRLAVGITLALLTVALPAGAQTFVFDLRGAQEVPAVPSTHSGGCMGTLDQAAATFSLTCVHDVAAATVMHIHRAPAGANGPVAFDLGNPASPVTATWSGMTAADISDLLAGNLYVNIHTAGRPSGEIRGQILPRTVDTVAFTADGMQVVPRNESEATANCTADLDAAATALAIQCTHDIEAPSAAHVHEAPSGQNGPVVYTFPTPTSPLSASVPLTPRLVASFAAAFLYLDIHTAGGTEDAPSEEIRGQIGTPPAGASSGTIIITKETAPAGGTSFGFTQSITGGAFTLDDGGSETFSNVAAGTYSVTENDPGGSGYSVAEVSCADANSSGNANTRTATIDVSAGETVRCTFHNFAAQATDTIFVFHLSGDQEVPAVTTAERGGCMARFDAAASRLNIVCTHDVDLPTLMHIHRGAAGVNGAVAFDMGEPTSPVIATWSGMTAADVADLLAGKLYVNVHTAGRPAGVIRGQILPRTVDAVSFTLDAAQVVPPGTVPYSGNCTADLDANATSLAVNCTHNLPSPASAHVHQAPRGENGPVVFTFPSPTSPISANVPMTPRRVADFAASFLYVDVHGGGGEESSATTRGQIAAPVAAPTTGTVRIVKSTSPAGGTGFTFTQTMTNGSFTLNHGGEEVFLDVPAGTYTVTENATPGWSLTDVTCGDGDSSGNPFTRSATIRLQGGESVTCTFRNLQNVAAPTQFVFHLSGDQEVPASNSTARGGCYGALDPATRRFSLVCTHDVTSPVVAHVHRAPAGAVGPIAFDLGDPATPIEATWNMSAAEVADLLAGNFYVNIHASGRPDGEIRGQIVTRSVDRFTFRANGAQEVPPTDSTATGDCLADLADNASSVFVQCTHDVATISDIHLHDAPPGVDGPVVFDFARARSFAAAVPLTPRLIADFAAGFLYVNVHSPNYEQGEIRGQLIGVAAPATHHANIPTLAEWAMLLMMFALASLAAWRVR